MCLLPVHGVFAAEEITPTVEIVNMLIKIASRARTIPAILAGKLMSNDFIYASWLWLDKSLFTMWNYMKNFANFTLWFILVFKIAKSLFTKDAFSIKKELPNFLLASILLNMSWFLMGTLIDISNVATAAVWSFPQALISDNLISSTGMQWLNVSIPEKICANLDKWEQKCNETFSATQRIDRVRARFNDMSWPLLYIGASIYRFQEYGLLNQKITDLKDFTIGTIIKLLMLLMYIAPIIALFVINLKRVFYLWLRIIFSPIIILGEVLKIDRIKNIGKEDKIFNVGEIIGMIFQPVFVIGGMAIVLILWVSMFAVMGWHPGSSNKSEQVSKVFGWAEIISSPGSSTFHNTTAWTEITFIWDIFKDVAEYSGWLVWYLIITTFVIMLLWAVVKMSTASSSIAKWTFDKVTSLGKDIVTWMNIIPMWWSHVSLASMMDYTDSKKTKDRIEKHLKIADKRDDAESNLYWGLNRSWLWKLFKWTYGTDMFGPINWEWDLTNKEIKNVLKLGDNVSSINGFMNNIYENISQKKWRKLTLSSQRFKDSIFESISKNETLKKEAMRDLWITDAKNFTSSALFDGTSASSKQFLDYLQRTFSWENIKLADANRNKTIPTDFIIYSNTKEEPKEPEADKPVTPVT